MNNKTGDIRSLQGEFNSNVKLPLQGTVIREMTEWFKFKPVLYHPSLPCSIPGFPLGHHSLSFGERVGAAMVCP